MSSPDQKVAAIAASFNTSLRQTKEAPMGVGRVAGTKRDVMQTLNERQVGNRKISV